MKHTRRHVALLIAATLLPASLFAQVTGQINVSVEAPAGAAVVNAAIRVYLSGGKKAVLETSTNSSGFFNIASLRPDTYDLEVQAPGFSTARVNAIHVDPARAVTVPPIKLEVSSVSQSVEVSAAATTV